MKSSKSSACDLNERGKKLEIKSTSITDQFDVDWNHKLGTGISGPVRAATRRSTGEKYAVKVVVDRPKATQEAQMHWCCSGHPHVVKIYEVFRNELQFPGESVATSRLLFILELMEGGELFFRISKQHGFTERQAANTTFQIALAVQHLHSMNIAHRDLKPENLLYKNHDDGSPIKLCDFGFAKLDNGDLATPQFTPYYVSPQVLEAQRRQRRERASLASSAPLYTYDKSCDMWSLGVIIYILMCGYPPFYSEHPSSRRAIDRSMRRKIMSGTYELHDREWERVSDHAKDVVRRLLCVDPHERLTIDELVQHPWLTEEAPDTLLQSPMYIANKSNMQEAATLHESHLQKMRIPDRSANLKPIDCAINPMLIKRQQMGREGSDRIQAAIEPEESRALKSLRDVIAACIYEKQDSNSKRGDRICDLSAAVRSAVEENPANGVLAKTLLDHGWDGSNFAQDPDLRELAYAIKDVVEHVKTQLHSHSMRNLN